MGGGNHRRPILQCCWIETLKCQDLQKYLARAWDPIPHIFLSVRHLTGRSGEYPVSPMDLNGNCCLHRVVGFSPGLDHLVDAAFSFILLCLSSFFLPSCLLYFFLSFYTYPSLSKAICICGNHACLCALSSPTHKLLLMWTHFHSTLLLFFFNVASKTLVWTVSHWNKSWNWWWWSRIIPSNKDGDMLYFPRSGHSVHVLLSIWNGFSHRLSGAFSAGCFWIQLTWDLRQPWAIVVKDLLSMKVQ